MCSDILQQRLSKITWLPKTKIRLSKKAKYLRLVINPAGFLEVVSPENIPTRYIEDFLIEKKSWIEKHSKDLEDSDISVPTSLHLRALEQKWLINFSPESDTTKLIISNSDKTLNIHTRKNNLNVVSLLLRKWLTAVGKKVFPMEVNDLAEKILLHPNKVSVRGQTTLWGSCNAKGNISLNYKILFFDRSLFHHVIIHELAHLRHMNHSKMFWKLVESHDQNFLINKKRLINATRYIPKIILL